MIKSLPRTVHACHRMPFPFSGVVEFTGAKSRASRESSHTQNYSINSNCTNATSIVLHFFGDRNPTILRGIKVLDGLMAIVSIEASNHIETIVELGAMAIASEIRVDRS